VSSYGRGDKLEGSGPRFHLGLADLRRFAYARAFREFTSLADAIERIGFVQADPIRAPARAQDLVLRQRVEKYRAGDLDSSYPELDVDEDVFVNYGFVHRRVRTLMHPRMTFARATAQKRVRDLLEFVRSRGEVHPRDAHAHFAHGTVTNYWGGASNATTQLLDVMHYRGLLRVARREGGIRVYAAQTFAAATGDPAERRRRLDALIDVAVGKYAPVPTTTLAWLVNRMRYAAPQWRRDLRAAVVRAKHRLAHAHVEGTGWYWPADEQPDGREPPAIVRLLAPFDPLVWDRRRFERLWGWAYRLEAYTPASKRTFGYYALPLAWRDRVVGWANVTTEDKGLRCEFGYADRKAPKERGFKRELDAEVARLGGFLKR
jgi:uncharacterized protein YcaQ